MYTHTTTRRLHKLFTFPARMAASLAGWAAGIARATDAHTPPARHRMGSWEASASLRARALRDAADES